MSILPTYLIMVAMPEEGQAVREAAPQIFATKFERISEKQIDLWKLTTADKQIYLIESQVGQVNSASALAFFLGAASSRLNLVLSTGTCGGILPYAQIGSLIVAEKYFFGAVDATELGYDWGQIPGMPKYYQSQPELLQNLKNHLSQKYPLVAGNVCTADVFFAKPQLDMVLSRFPKIVSVDMESAAIAQVCYKFNVNFAMLRCVSDLCFSDQGETFTQEKINASTIAATASLNFLRELR